MAKLKDEYVDVKSVHHRVEHLTLVIDDKAQQEQILEELTHALSKFRKIPA